MFKNEFNSLYGLVNYFDGEDMCYEYLAEKRWGGQPWCPHCECQKVYCFRDNKRYKCSGCRKQFTSRTGTIFESTKLPLKKWFMAIYLISSHKRGISSYQLARDIAVTQKTAWMMLTKLRYAFGECDIECELEGIVEIDETFVGGKNKNRHKDKKVKNSQGRAFKDKTPVFGMLERDGIVVAKVVSDTKAKTLRPYIDEYIKKGSTICSDEWNYGQLEPDYTHWKVYHASKVYAIGENYTNTIESFWSHAKRMIIGVYFKTSRKHLQKYVDEISFRFNHRKLKEGERFEKMLSLLYQRITCKDIVYG